MKVNDIIQPLTEMPIRTFNTIGDFSKNSSFKKPIDRALVTNPKSVQKIKNMFAKTQHDFNMFMVNLPEARPFTEIGYVNYDWIEARMPKVAVDIRPYLSTNAINIIFTNNSADEHYPMTGWILAHRISHALSRNISISGVQEIGTMRKAQYVTMETLSDIFNEYYGIPLKGMKYGDARYPNPASWTSLDRKHQLMLKKFFHQIGTFKSARDSNIRDYFEFLHECFAQYLINGEVKFNPLPKRIVIGHSFGKPYYNSRKAPETDYDYYDNNLQALAETLTDEFAIVLNDATGKILVM